MSVTINGVAPTTAQQREFAAAMGLPVLLQTITVSAAQQDIDFSSLSLDSDRSYKIELSLVPNSAADQLVFVYFNSDFTNANYQKQTMSGDGSTTSSQRVADSGCMGGGTPNSTNFTILSMANIVKVAGKMPVISTENSVYSAGSIARTQCAASWNGTANVTAIKLRHTSNFGVGTVAKIYRA